MMENWSEETSAHWRDHYDCAANSWAKWADQLADQQVKINEGLLAAAAVGTGTQLLDLASGVGEPAVTASRLVGDKGQVTATDSSAPMIAALVERLAKHGLRNVRCEQADMQALPFRDEQFDAVTCRYGLMYAHDPKRAIAEARRVVKQGKRLAFMVWGPESANSLLFHGLRAANEFWGHPLAEAEFAAPTRFAGPGMLLEMMKSVGILDAQEQDLIFEPTIKVGVPFWTPLVEMNANGVWNRLSGLERKKTHEVIGHAYERFVVDGSYVLKTHMKVVSGSRSAFPPDA